MKPGIVAEPCCLPTGMCVCVLVKSTIFSQFNLIFGWQKIIPATVVLSQGHSLPTPVAPSHWQMEAFQLHPKPVKLWES